MEEKKKKRKKEEEFRIYKGQRSAVWELIPSAML